LDQEPFVSWALEHGKIPFPGRRDGRSAVERPKDHRLPIDPTLNPEIFAACGNCGEFGSSRPPAVWVPRAARAAGPDGAGRIRTDGRQGGRRSIVRDKRSLLNSHAREPVLGLPGIVGELRGLGISISARSVRTILLRRGLPPAPQRDELSRRNFLRQYAATERFVAAAAFGANLLSAPFDSSALAPPRRYVASMDISATPKPPQKDTFM
jgi:hypothetical protein